MKLLLPLCTSLLLALALTACGGGADKQTVSQVKVSSLKYGQAASILVAGENLRTSMTATTGACKDAHFSADSTTRLGVITCTVTAVGEQALSITSTSGEVLYQGSITVPQPVVALLTSQGNVLLQLNPAVVPSTVANFLAYVNAGYYSNTLFHRVIPGFVAQAGGYTTGLVSKPGQTAPIALESNKGLSNVRGSLAMARTSVPDSATSEFYINLVDNLSLDYQNAAQPGYAVFGQVVSGMDVIDAIAALPTATVNGVPNVPASDITIKSAVQTQ